MHNECCTFLRGSDAEYVERLSGAHEQTGAEGSAFCQKNMISRRFTMIKKIVGHKGAMSLTERVYTHPDIKALVDAVNMI